MSRYKNVSDQELSIAGVGIVKPGHEAEMPEGFHNANFVPVKKRVEDNKSDKNEQV